jgi:hypothetical protein
MPDDLALYHERQRRTAVENFDVERARLLTMGMEVVGHYLSARKWARAWKAAAKRQEARLATATELLERWLVEAELHLVLQSGVEDETRTFLDHA